MDPAFLLGHLDPTNKFAMEGLNMAFARQLLLEGKSLPEMLFIDVMVEKTQILIEHIKNHHLGLCLTATLVKTQQLSKCMTTSQQLIPSYSI